MSQRSFDAWIAQFKTTIYDFDYYVDFAKVYEHVDEIEDELNLLNGLVGKPNPEKKFRELMKSYPQIRKALPILIAYRSKELEIIHHGKSLMYNFGRNPNTVDEYVLLMRETGLFDMFSNHIIGDVRDYVCGVEVGMDTNARKNRGGTSMENLVCEAIEAAGFKLGTITPNASGVYASQVKLSRLAATFPNLDLDPIAGGDNAEKKLDFVVKTARCLYGIEVNFYTGGGSKLNETARSYKEIALASKGIDGFKFVWFTDGKGWNKAKANLKETFMVLDDLYNINDIENGIMRKVFI